MKSDWVKTEYRKYRQTAIIIWIFFIGICLVLRFCCKIYNGFYVAGVYFLFGLDILFFSRYCLFNFLYSLRKIKEIKNKKLACCYTCPIRGWDMPMMTSPLLLLLSGEKSPILFIVICAVLFSIIVMISWERVKFKFIHRNKNCEKCGCKCGEEYNNTRICLRNINFIRNKKD